MLWGFVLPLAFDFRKFEEEEGVGAQIALLGLALTFGATYILLEELSPRLVRRSALRRITTIWWLYILLSPLPVLVWNVNIEHYLKILLPFGLFGIALSVVCSMERRNVDPAVVLDMLLWAGVLGALWRVAYGISAAGLSLDAIRWEILGPSVPLLIGFGAAGLYLKERIVVSSATLLLGLSIATLSVTRSYLSSLLIVVGGLLVIEMRRKTLVNATRLGIKVALSAAVVILIAGALAHLFRPDIVSAWTSRLTEHSTEGGLDLTLVTRFGEIKGQLTALTESIGTLLIGKGVGSEYQLDQAVLEILPFLVEDDSKWFAGHSTWVYPFFASGLILGCILPLILMLGLKNGYITATKRSHHKASTGAIMAFIIFCAYLGQSFTSNLLNERYGALILGLVTGCLFLYGGRESRMTQVFGRAETGLGPLPAKLQVG
jgi:hypothetical protein